MRDIQSSDAESQPLIRNRTTATENSPPKARTPQMAPSERSYVKESSSPSRFVTFMRKLYKPLGFNKGYNFLLFVIFGGTIFIFCLTQLPLLNVSGSSKSRFRNTTLPNEWYYYRAGLYRIGITMHLLSVIPLGILMGWQFVPVIRYKFMIFHRINGYIIILLTFTSNIGALLIARRAFGGSLETQAGVGVLAILITVSIIMAYINIKRLQIDQHRAWMLRAMFYLGSIVTMRVVINASVVIISLIGSYSQIQTCGLVDYSLASSGGSAASLYPECASANATADTEVIVQASVTEPLGMHSVSAAMNLVFGMSVWMAIALHVVGVEIYLGLTPRESERLRMVSYEKQLAAGFEHPGSSGLTSDRWGDAEEWKPTKSVGSDEVVPGGD